MLICFLWKRECRQNCYTLWERLPATWHEVLLAFISLSFYCRFCSLWDTLRKKKRKKIKGGRGDSTNMWKRCENTWVVTELVGWMLRRGSEQMKARKNELSQKVISKYKWIHKLSSCCLQCQNWPREDTLEQTPALLGEFVLGLSTDTRGIQDNISVFQRATAFVAGLFCLLVEWRPTENPQKSVQPETVCTLIHHCHICFFNIFLFHFVLREVDVVDVDVVAISGNWRWKH